MSLLSRAQIERTPHMSDNVNEYRNLSVKKLTREETIAKLKEFQQRSDEELHQSR